MRPEVPGTVFPVPMELRHLVARGAEQVLHIQHVHPAVTGRILHVGDDGLVCVAVASGIGVHVVVEQGWLVLASGDGRAAVARRNQLPQAQMVEVQGEVLEEVRLVGVVAVAQDNLAFEMIRVVPQLVLDVWHPRVELVVLDLLGG